MLPPKLAQLWSSGVEILVKLPQRQIWLDTEEEYMKESNIPAGNTENSFQERERLLDIIGMLIKANNHKTQL